MEKIQKWEYLQFDLKQLQLSHLSAFISMLHGYDYDLFIVFMLSLSIGRWHGSIDAFFHGGKDTSADDTKHWRNMVQ